MTTQSDLAATQAATAQAQSDLSTVTSGVATVSSAAQKLVTDLGTIATDLTKIATDIGAAPLALAAITPIAVVVNTPIPTTTLLASGGTAPYVYAVLPSTPLPAGITLAGSSLRGTPTAVAKTSVTVSVTDTSTPPKTAIQTFSITVASTVTPPPPPPTTVPLWGAYCGAGSGAIAAVKALAAAVGKQANLLSTYCDGTSWTSISQGDWDLSQYQGMSERLVIGVNVYVGNGNQLTDLAAGATGAHNATYTALAQNLIKYGLGNAILRIGWEPDVNIFSNEDIKSAQNYAAFFRQIHSTMMAVPGANFVFSWYFGGNFDDTTINASYPGDAYVDCVENDPYDQSWQGSPCTAPYNSSNFTQAQHQCIWTNQQLPALNRQAAFATAHGKPLSFGEHGVIKRSDGHGGGDDPYWVTDFLAWVASHNVLWMSYFDANSGGDSILSDFPNSEAAYKAAAI